MKSALSFKFSWKWLAQGVGLAGLYLALALQVKDTGSFIAEDIAKCCTDGADYFITKRPQFGTIMDIVRAVDKCLGADPVNCAALARFSVPGGTRLAPGPPIQFPATAKKIPNCGTNRTGLDYNKRK